MQDKKQKVQNPSPETKLLKSLGILFRRYSDTRKGSPKRHISIIIFGGITDKKANELLAPLGFKQVNSIYGLRFSKTVTRAVPTAVT